jgi:hypothetical protein
MRKKMLALPVVLVLAVSLFGLAYAHWSDMVYIEGTVDMGSLTLAFDYVEPPQCVEYYKDPDTGALIPGEWLGKDVGNCCATRLELIEDVHTGKLGYKLLCINVTNAYPQYFVHTTFIVHNIGTIPIHLVDFIIWDPTGQLDFMWISPPPASPALGLFYKDFNGNQAYDDGEEIINVKLVNFVCTQLDPCNSTKGEIDIDFKQPAEECHTYRFMAMLVGVQWNKAYLYP